MIRSKCFSGQLDMITAMELDVHPNSAQAARHGLRGGQLFGRRRQRLFIVGIVVAGLLQFTALVALAQEKPGGQPGTPSLPDLNKYPGLLPEIGQLFVKLQHDVQFPPARRQSRLLPLLPESTILYAAFPNYGEASHQALMIFKHEVQQSSVLRDWWQHGDMATRGPQVEDSLGKMYQFSQYLGDEIVVSGATEGGKDPHLLIFAEVRKPGLKDFLQQMSKEALGKTKTSVRVMEVQELATAKEKRKSEDLLILVRPDFVVGALDVDTLRRFNGRLDKGITEFASTAFGQRLTQAYEGGLTVVAAADLRQIVNQLPIEKQNQNLFERTGFKDAKYLVWEHHTVDGQAISEIELSFNGPRRGIASWLAPPGPLGSMDFVSPQAIVAGAVLLKSPAVIFDDVNDLAAASNPNAFIALEQMEQRSKIDLKEDLLNHLSGEIAYEIDSLAPNPTWKAMLRVSDSEHIKAVFDKLLAFTGLTVQQSEDDGTTYYTLQVPSQQKPFEISYAFVDSYLVLASSRDAVAEAARIHRTGESLGKSKSFSASLPPGRLADVSALLYEDPVAMMAWNMRRVSPEMADLFSQSGTQKTPAVIAGYGEESALREATRSGGVDVGATLVVAAIAIPNLLRARTAANESSAVSSIRTVNVAEITYQSTYPRRGFARDLASLGPDPASPGKTSANHADFLDAKLADASCTAGAWCEKSGFRFSLKAVCDAQKCKEFVVVGTPVDANTGSRSFCSISDGVVRFKIGPPLVSLITVSECRSWSPLQ